MQRSRKEKQRISNKGRRRQKTGQLRYVKTKKYTKT